MIILACMNAEICFKQIILFQIPFMNLAQNFGQKTHISFVGIFSSADVTKDNVPQNK